jgi:single-stranded-DNA-specific exonuclease
MIPELKRKNEKRKAEIRERVSEIEQKLSLESGEIIFEGGADWDYHLISPLASILCRKFKKPTFLFKQLEKESQGTVRVPRGIDSVALMKKCRQHLITFGGHALASGFRVKNENKEKFKQCLIDNL